MIGQGSFTSSSIGIQHLVLGPTTATLVLAQQKSSRLYRELVSLDLAVLFITRGMLHPGS
jgi:hypothetical protein